MLRRDARGFTLVELLIVIVILSIVAAIGYPAMTDYVRKSRRAQAKAVLQDLILRQERWRANNTSYNGTIESLTDLTPSVTNTFSDTDADNNLVSDYYVYSVSSSSTTGFTLEADAKSGTSQEESDGTCLDTLRGFDPDNDTCASKPELCCCTLTLNESQDPGLNLGCW
jgi:type IV pilus assembly protein PilE